MEFSEFVRKPFKIEAVQITEENMDELCELIGHEVKTKGTSRFIVVNRKIVPNGFRAFVGWWVTQMGDNLRCYPKRVFENQFTEMSDEWASWFEEDTSGETHDVEGIPVEDVQTAVDDTIPESVIVQGDIRNEAVEVTVIDASEEEHAAVDRYRRVDAGEHGGEYVTAEYAAEHPDTTVHERDYVTPSEPVVVDTFEQDVVEPYQG